MRTLLTVTFLILFTWNSVLGGMEGLVLCIHRDGVAHLDLLDKSGSPLGESQKLLDSPSATLDCPPCERISIDSVDLGSLRPDELENLDFSRPSASAGPIQFSPDGRLQPDGQIVPIFLPRAPPNSEPIAKQVCRVIVLRI